MCVHAVYAHWDEFDLTLMCILCQLNDSMERHIYKRQLIHRQILKVCKQATHHRLMTNDEDIFRTLKRGFKLHKLVRYENTYLQLHNNRL